MQRSLSPRGVVLLLALFSLLGRPDLVAGPRRSAGQQPQPTFRTGVTAVPIDVRVVDRDGRPVADLREEDFTVFEDDVRQPIVHFSRQVLAAEQPGPAARARTDVPAFDAAPQTHRLFLIVIGAGALGSMPLVNVSPSGSVHGPRTVVRDPSKSLDGLVHLVRHLLLPQDQVALLVRNRATDFTVDHESVATLLETFKKSEEAGLAAFADRATAMASQTPSDPLYAGTATVVDALPAADLGFAEYVEARARTTSDLETVQYGIKYLRYMEGEKHLVYVTARGMMQPMTGTVQNQAWQDPKQLAAAASDARVALHVIQTGGVSSNPGDFLPALPAMTPFLLVPGLAYFGSGTSGAVGGAPSDRGEPGAPRANAPQPGWDRPPIDPPVPVPGTNATSLQALSDLRTLAFLTGGTASIMTGATSAVERINAQTMVDYVLAYYPSNGVPDGRYRAVRVEVNRPDVTVLFRHGYYARQQNASMNRRSVITEGRLRSAMTSAREFRDIGLRVTPTFTARRSGKDGDILVRMVIDGSRLGWTTDDLMRRVARLEVGVFCGDAKERLVGQATRVLDVTLTEARFARLAAEGLPYNVSVPVKSSPRFVKVIVYNYEANLLGSAVVRMK